MKVLLINKFYFQKGGAERYVFSLQDLLEDAGHHVVPFAMHHPKNVKSEADRYFVSKIELENPKIGWDAVRAPERIMYSHEAARKLAALIDAYEPDVAHLNNIYHQLSPSVLAVLKKKKIPTVQTIHDYAYLSPSYGLFDHGAICERVKPRNYFAAVKHRCVKNSFFASLLDAAAYSYHTRAGLDERLVGRLIAPSAFVKKKFAEWGRDVSRMSVVPHFISSEHYEPNYTPGSEVVYVGRLSEEKGIGVLVAAMERAPHERLKIIGTGPMEKRLKDYVATNNVHNITFAGALDHAQVLKEIAASRFVVIPSLSFETFGYAALEAHCMGKPVVASEIGALPEVVVHNETGLLVQPNNVSALAEHIKALSGNEPILMRMGRTARERVEQLYRPQDHLGRIEEIYQNVILGA